MAMLISGLLLFALVHFIPSMAVRLKSSWIDRMGENGYKGIFSLLLLASFALMIFGWRNTDPAFVYFPAAGLHVLGLILVVLGFWIMGASNRNSRIRRVIRHPQLTGVAMWGVAHLLLNGESRSIILFGGLTIWAILEMIAINRREGAWIKEDAPAWSYELVTLLIAVGVVAVLVLIHPWLSGVPVW